jgi:curved DNA-binding protein CbpA
MLWDIRTFYASRFLSSLGSRSLEKFDNRCQQYAAEITMLDNCLCRSCLSIICRNLETLGSQPTDSLSTIKKNYRRLVKKYHSDSESYDFQTDKSVRFAEDRLIEVIGAYDTIESCFNNRERAQKLNVCALCGRTRRHDISDTADTRGSRIEERDSGSLRFSLKDGKRLRRGLVTAIFIVGLVVVAVKHVSRPDPVTLGLESDEHLADITQESMHPNKSATSTGNRSDDLTIDPLKDLYEECLRECEDMRRAGSVNIFSTPEATCKQRCLEGYSLIGVY